MAGQDYRSRFEHWDTQAWVRSKPRPATEFRTDLHYFSPDLCPPLVHPAVRAQPAAARERLLVHQLYLYLEFTVRLETGPVNDACLLLRDPAFLPWLPTGMRRDALRIYTDEAGHAEMSHTLLSAVADRTGVAPIPHEPAFLRELDRLGEPADSAPEASRSLLVLFFAIVSETLITASLSRLPRDDRVQAQVRALAADHAADEGRHHAYFRQIFTEVWPRLPAASRRRIGVLLPRMILAFLSPDQPAMGVVLADCGVENPETVAAEVATAPQTVAAIQEAAQPTLRMFALRRMFDDPVIAEAFAASQLPMSPETATEPPAATDAGPGGH